MDKKQRQTLAKLHEYALKIGRHKPSLNTKYWRYRDFALITSDILYANFGAWSKENPEQAQDQECIKEGFEKLEQLYTELSNE